MLKDPFGGDDDDFEDTINWDGSSISSGKVGVWKTSILLTNDAHWARH